MIKIIGVLLFGSLGIGMIILGISEGKQGPVVLGGVTTAVVVLGIVAVRLFPHFFDSEENARLGMKVISKAALKSIRDTDH